MIEPTRRHPRYEIETTVIYKVEPRPGTPAPSAKAGRSRNLSQGGLLLEAEERLPPGTRLSLILVRGKREVIEGHGEAVWAAPSAETPWICHGVRITGMEAQHQLAWELFLDEASREIGHRAVRFDIDFALTCRWSGDQDGCQGRAVNIGRGGLLVLLPSRHPLGAVLSLQIHTPHRSLSTEAQVVRHEAPRADGLIPHGLTFVDPQEGSRLLPEILIVGLL